MYEKPVKQFYNKKTKKWHVYFKNPVTGKMRIKEVNNYKIAGLKVIGNDAPDTDEITEVLYGSPENKNDQKNEFENDQIDEPKNDQNNEHSEGRKNEYKTSVKNEPAEGEKDRPKDESKNKDSSSGYFDFL